MLLRKVDEIPGKSTMVCGLGGGGLTPIVVFNGYVAARDHVPARLHLLAIWGFITQSKVVAQ